MRKFGTFKTAFNIKKFGFYLLVALVSVLVSWRNLKMSSASNKLRGDP
jgi:hypothetical protein